jgi:hypothetical protein
MRGVLLALQLRRTMHKPILLPSDQARQRGPSAWLVELEEAG